MNCGGFGAIEIVEEKDGWRKRIDEIRGEVVAVGLNGRRR